MNLHDTDYSTISKEDEAAFNEIKKQEIINIDGKPSIFTRSMYHLYPQAIRHNLSLFPNNFIDRVDIRDSKEKLKPLVHDFNELLNDVKISERDILNFIKTKRCWFIIGGILKKYNFGHHAQYIFPEFQLPPNYQADYLIVGENSDGHHFVFVELENPHGEITVKDGSWGTTIRKGIKQIEDWDSWIESNYSHLKLVFDTTKKQGNVLPEEYQALDKTRIHFVVIAGRRSDYTAKTYRLRRRYHQTQKILILHYDNLIDLANSILE